MTFQTLQKDDKNKYKNSPEGLQNGVCSIWLRIMDEVRTVLILNSTSVHLVG
jgi:hypothetical protein